MARARKRLMWKMVKLAEIISNDERNNELIESVKHGIILCEYFAIETTGKLSLKDMIDSLNNELHKIVLLEIIRKRQLNHRLF